jgi:hypothetical protein
VRKHALEAGTAYEGAMAINFVRTLLEFCTVRAVYTDPELSIEAWIGGWRPKHTVLYPVVVRHLVVASPRKEETP